MLSLANNVENYSFSLTLALITKSHSFLTTADSRIDLISIVPLKAIRLQGLCVFTEK